MRQKYKLGKFYWILDNTQPIKVKLTSAVLNTTTINGTITRQAIDYIFSGVYKETIDNRKICRIVREEEIFSTLIELSKHYNLK